MKNWLILCFGILFATGCASSNKRITLPEPPEIKDEQYLIGVGDQISVQVWKAPELSVDIPVRPDGKISAPLVGDVAAAGETTEDLADTLAKGFSKYVRNPQVTVMVLNPSSGEYLRRVRVTGGVESPQSIPHQQGMTVLDLVLQAGGLTEYAVGNKAKLYRKYGDKAQVFPVYLDDILQKGDLKTNYIVAPSDIVTVPERVF